ncbi:50S ribosomal subunit protein L30 [Gammaproteobacteria bacterium]
MSDKTLKVTLVRSRYGRLPAHRATISAMGLRKIGQTVVLKDSPQVRGMVQQVSYLLRMEESV